MVEIVSAQKVGHPAHFFNVHIYIISEESSIFAPQRLRLYKALGVAACTV